jgi:hypothetical protein
VRLQLTDEFGLMRSLWALCWALTSLSQLAAEDGLLLPVVVFKNTRLLGETWYFS